MSPSTPSSADPGAVADALLQPISDHHPGGDDLAYSSDFDLIREARRSDDTGLSQGEWETDLKSADWPLVRERCEHLLRSRTKDLLLAVWYTEAQARLQGFAGLAAGASLVNGLLRDFWEFMYPPLDPDDLDERTGKIEWLAIHVTAAVRQIALTQPASGGYSWMQWQESREVENLSLRSADAAQAAIGEGKISGEAFDKAVTASGARFYQVLLADIQAADRALAELDLLVDQQFGAQAPSIKPLRESVAQCLLLVERFHQKLSGVTSRKLPPPPAPAAGPVSGTASATAAFGTEPRQSLVPQVPALSLGDVAIHRAEVVAQLHQISQFFRATEPHSPVALLVERAARWADMPLEQWLSAVIKDDATLKGLDDLLDIRR